MAAKENPDTAGIVPFKSGFRGVENIPLNAPQNYWGQDGSFNIAGGAASQPTIPSSILEQYPQLAAILQQYGMAQPPQVADLRSPAVAAPAPAATVATKPSPFSSKMFRGRNITGDQWKQSGKPNLRSMIEMSMLAPK